MSIPFHDFACSLQTGDLPEAMLVLLRRSFLDTMGVAAIGATTDMAAIARRGALAQFGVGTAGGARILMDGRLTSPTGAAMAGAFTVDSVDAHDGTTPNKGHAGSAVFPAVLAVPMRCGQGGRRSLARIWRCGWRWRMRPATARGRSSTRPVRIIIPQGPGPLWGWRLPVRECWAVTRH